MANEQQLSNNSTQATRVNPYESEDDLTVSAVVRPVTAIAKSPVNGSSRPVQGDYVASEVAGDAVVRTIPDREGEIETAGAHDEVGSDGTESGGEYLEATPAQLLYESGEESAISDLRGIEGFETRESSAEGGMEGDRPLRDSGAGMEAGQEEFLPILAALVPTLISSVGPAVAKAVAGRLSPRSKQVIQRLPRSPVGPNALGTAAKSAIGAAKGAGGKPQLLALLAKLLETAQQRPGGESGMEVEEAFVQEAVAALEVIIGTDDRVRITATTEVPWRRICALRIHFPSGATYRGSGFLIGPRAIATAGHCVYLHAQGGWARRVEVIPGCNGTARPFGQCESTSFRSVGGWVTGKKPTSDYGCIVLPVGAFGGRNLGSLGFAAFDAPALLAQPAVVAGYPGDKPFAEAWGMARLLKTVTAETLIYDIDSMGGQSGAPVYITRGGQRYVVGIHNYGAATGNSATRVTRPVYERLRDWSKI